MQWQEKRDKLHGPLRQTIYSACFLAKLLLLLRLASFENDCNALASTNAGSAQSPLLVESMQVVGQVGENSKVRRLS